MWQPTRILTIICFVLIGFCFANNAIGQLKKISAPYTLSEGNFYSQNDTLYADAVVVKFRDHVVDSRNTMGTIAAEDINSNFLAVKNFIN